MMKHFDIEKFKAYLCAEIDYFNMEIKENEEKLKALPPILGDIMFDKHMRENTYQCIDYAKTEKYICERLLDEIENEEYYYECNCESE